MNIKCGEAQNLSQSFIERGNHARIRDRVGTPEPLTLCACIPHKRAQRKTRTVAFLEDRPQKRKGLLSASKPSS